MPNLNSRKAEQGSTLVEFAAVLTILLALTFGMIDFGRYVYAISAVRAAAQEGARAGIELEDLGNLQTVAESAAESKMVALDTSKAVVTAIQPNAETVEVDITYEFEFITPLLAAATSGPIEINGSASMVIY